jgi:hypothetical protein
MTTYLDLGVEKAREKTILWNHPFQPSPNFAANCTLQVRAVSEPHCQCNACARIDLPRRDISLERSASDAHVA